MFRRRLALLGFLSWRIGKVLGKRKRRSILRAARLDRRYSLPLIGSGLAAVGLFVVAWRVLRQDDAESDPGLPKPFPA